MNKSLLSVLFVSVIVLIMSLSTTAQWLQPDQYLTTVHGCDNSTLAPQQFCETIHRWPRALNAIEGMNTTEAVLEAVAMSFLSSIKVKNPDAVANGTTPKYDIPSGDCAGAISNVLCAKFFMRCDAETGEPMLPCKKRCQQVRKNCKGEPLSAYGKAFYDSLDCNDKTKFSSSQCTSAASRFQVFTGAVVATLLATVFLMF